MNEQVFQLTLTQLALLMFAVIAMFAPSSIIILAIIALSTTFTYSLASSLTLSKKLRQADSDETHTKHDAILGTHMGGALCYAIMLNLLINNLL